MKTLFLAALLVLMPFTVSAHEEKSTMECYLRGADNALTRVACPANPEQSGFTQTPQYQAPQYTPYYAPAPVYTYVPPITVYRPGIRVYIAPGYPSVGVVVVPAYRHHHHHNYGGHRRPHTTLDDYRHRPKYR